jgi:hypothetical protein
MPIGKIPFFKRLAERVRWARWPKTTTAHRMGQPRSARERSSGARGMQSGRRSWLCRLPGSQATKNDGLRHFRDAVEQTFVVCRLPCSQATKNDGLRHFRECSGADVRGVSSARLAGHKKRWPAPLSGMQWSRRSRGVSSAVFAGHKKRWPAPLSGMQWSRRSWCVVLPCSQAQKNDGLRHFRECSGADVRGVSSAMFAGHKKRWPAPLSGMQWSRRSRCVVCQARRPQKNDGLRHFRECSGADDRDLSSAMLAGHKKNDGLRHFPGMQWGRRS